MRKEEIKNIMIIHSDNDFVRIWDWVGKITLFTLKNKNICDEEMLEDSVDIEKFIHSLLSTSIEFTQYRVGKYEEYCRYKDIDSDELNRLVECFNYISFHYNVEETDEEWEIGGCETLIIDLENNKSYIR